MAWELVLSISSILGSNRTKSYIKGKEEREVVEDEEAERKKKKKGKRDKKKKKEEEEEGEKEKENKILN